MRVWPPTVVEDTLSPMTATLRTYFRILTAGALVYTNQVTEPFNVQPCTRTTNGSTMTDTSRITS